MDLRVWGRGLLWWREEGVWTQWGKGGATEYECRHVFFFFLSLLFWILYWGRITANNTIRNWFSFNNTNFWLTLNNTKFDFIFPSTFLFTCNLWRQWLFYFVFLKKLSNTLLLLHFHLLLLTLLYITFFYIEERNEGCLKILKLNHTSSPQIIVSLFILMHYFSPNLFTNQN